VQQYLVELINNVDFLALWQWFSSLPLLPKILGILGPIAAAVGLAVNLPKAYSLLRGVVAKIEVKRFSLVERAPGLVDFQLDLCVHATHGNVNSKGILLKNKTKFHLQYNEPICLYNDPDNNLPSNKATVKLAISRGDFEFTQFTEDRFVELFSKKLASSQIDILGFHIPENSFKCLTLAGRLKGRNIYGTNFSRIPLKDWSVVFEYGKREIEVALEPLIIDDSQTRN
jgi:hypothetical protein